MGRWLRAALALLALVDLSSRASSSSRFTPLPGAYPSITNKTFIKWVVDVHNKLRSEVNPPASNMLYMVVWDNSYKVGCAIVFCSRFESEIGKSENQEIFVCNYGPSGNYPRRPYTRGRPCSKCPAGDTCKNNLCRNPTREKIIYYTRWYPPFEFRIVCDQSCIAVAILRPLLMFIAFGAVYYLQQCYPGLSFQQ